MGFGVIEIEWWERERERERERGITVLKVICSVNGT